MKYKLWILQRIDWMYKNKKITLLQDFQMIDAQFNLIKHLTN